jgi:hypothetical protein
MALRLASPERCLPFQEEREVRMRAETNKSVDTLNELLRGEFSAVETYRQAIEKLGSSGAVGQLEDCRRSHEQRVARLRDEVMRLGGQPAEGSGAWGAFARLFEGGAKAFGEKAAVGALEEGEDHGLKLYRSNSDIDKLDLATRDFVERSLLPEQERTHRTTSQLKHSQH